MGWLLVSLGLVEEGQSADFLATLTSLTKTTAHLMSSWKIKDVSQLLKVRNDLISLLVLLLQLSSIEEGEDFKTVAVRSSAPTSSTPPPLSGLSAVAPVEEWEEGEEERANELAMPLAEVFDSIKELIAGISDELVTVGRMHDDNDIVTLYRRFRALVSLAPIESPQGWRQVSLSIVV